QRRPEITLKADIGNGRLDLFDGGGADARTPVQHAVHGRKGNAGRPRHIMHRGPASQTDVVHTGTSMVFPELWRRAPKGQVGRCPQAAKQVTAGANFLGAEMAIAVSNFGNFNGKRVDQFSLVSDTGVAVD